MKIAGFRVVSFLSFSFLYCGAFASLAAQASVTIYRDAEPVESSYETQTPVFTGDGTKINKGLAHQDVIRFVNQNLTTFGLKTPVNGEVLELRSVHVEKNRATVRVIQRFARVKIEGAELVATFSKNGKLVAVNSSLMPTPPSGFNVQPELSRETALANLKTQYAENEDLQAIEDRGLIIRKPGALGSDAKSPVLFWQFYLLAKTQPSETPVRVLVVARGPNKGKVRAEIPLAHSMISSRIQIHDGSLVPVVPNPHLKGVLVFDGGKETLKGKILATVDKKVYREAKQASDNLTRVVKFYETRLGRKSWDGQGADTIASVNAARFKPLDLLSMSQNAAWMGPWKMFVFGTGGEQLADFTGALDVVGHEFTHAVIESTSNLAYEGQSGGLNESLADIFGAWIENAEKLDHGKWYLLGDSVLKGALANQAEALRNLLEPHRGLDPQPETVAEIDPSMGPGCVPSNQNDACGVHSTSGIPNRAVALMVRALGWEKVGPMTYSVMAHRLRSTSDFRDFAAQMLAECKDTLTGSECSDVRSALQTVGAI